MDGGRESQASHRYWLRSCMITVIQARKTIAQAEEQHKLSVAPDWEVVEQSSESYTTGPNTRIARIALLNSGSGPARHPAIRFEPHNDNRPSRISPGIQGAKGRYSPSSVVPPMHLLTIRRTWYIDNPLDGLVILTYETRFGDLALSTGVSRRDIGPGAEHEAVRQASTHYAFRQQPSTRIPG